MEENTSQVQQGTESQIDPRVLRPHPDNPRHEIDVTAPEFRDFVADIAQRGVIQNLVVTPEHYILAGHRRREAAIIAGLPTVPVTIRVLKKSEFAEEYFLAENRQRQDLSPLEEARAVAAIRKKLSKYEKREIPLADLCRRLNLQPATVRDRLHILDLPERVQKLFHLCELPLRSAHQLARIKQWPEEVEKFADRMVTRQITVASLDALITRRIPDLQKGEDNKAILARDGKMRGIRQKYPENSYTPALTREIVAASLAKKTRSSISMFNVQVVFEQTCCSCGMVGNESVCLSCPLPKFLNGLIGRSSGGDATEDEE